MKNIILILILLSCAGVEQKSRSISSTTSENLCGKVEEINSNITKVEFQIPIDETIERKMQLFVNRNFQKLISILPLGSKLIIGDDNGVLVGNKHSIHDEDESVLSHHLMTIPLTSLDKTGKSFVATAVDTNSFLCFSRDNTGAIISIREDTFY